MIYPDVSAENTNCRIAQFIEALKKLEDKYGFEIDHHGYFVSYLRDRTISNNRAPIVATLSNDSDWEEI
jgi:hypothetical protein